MFPEYARSVWDDVVGQQRAVDQLDAVAQQPVHAYLFVGPDGCTKDIAARGFAALLLTGLHDPSTRDARLALDGQHPDVNEFRRVANTFSVDEIKEMLKAAALAPMEGERKVLIVHDLDAFSPEGAARLLKTFEEPTSSTVFILLAEQVPQELVTVASRCVRIEFGAIGTDEIRDRLVHEGVGDDDAVLAAAASHGSLSRARVLATDPSLVERREAFASAPSRLDGTGAAVAAVVKDLVGLIDRAMDPLLVRQQQDVADLEARVALVGERGSGRADLVARHKREQRRFRTDEWRAGLALLAAAYRDALVAGAFPRPDAVAEAVHRIHRTIEAFDRNGAEVLQMHALLLDLPGLPATAGVGRDGRHR